MRALVKEEPGRGMVLREVADPVAGPGEVVVRVGAAGVCGSDVARYVWTRNYEAGGAKSMEGLLPRILGHEFAGTVVGEVPAGSGLSSGGRVVISNILGCGVCAECEVGRPNTCANRKTIGVHRDGGYAELVAVPAANCSVIPDRMSMHLAAGLQPFAVATHAVQQAGLEPGSRVVVWGLGPIGLAVALTARLRGAEVVAGFDLSGERVADARALEIAARSVDGLDVAAWLRQESGLRSVDAFFDAAGALGQIVPHVAVLKKRAPIVMIGNVKDDVTFDVMPMIMDEQRLLGSRSYSLRSWDQAIATILHSGFDRTLGTEVLLDEAVDAFEAAADGTGRPFTILPNGPEH